MPWCPKCKNEYQDGIRLCADCGCELVDKLTEREEIADGTYEEMEGLSRFLKSNGIGSAYAVSKEGDLYCVTADAVEAKHARQIQPVFWMELRAESEAKAAAEAKAAGTDTEETDAEEAVADGLEERKKAAGKKSSAGVYQEASQKAENFRSGAYTLLAVGVIGLIFVFLLITGILPLSMNLFSKITTCIVMGGLFIVFIVMGISSFKSYEKQASEAVKESALKEELLRYCNDNLCAQQIDGALGISPEEDDAEAYFKRCEEIRRRISENFLNLNEDYLDHFVDEVYGQIYQNS